MLEITAKIFNFPIVVYVQFKNHIAVTSSALNSEISVCSSKNFCDFGLCEKWFPCLYNGDNNIWEW